MENAKCIINYKPPRARPEARASSSIWPQASANSKHERSAHSIRPACGRNDKMKVKYKNEAMRRVVPAY